MHHRLLVTFVLPVPVTFADEVVQSHWGLSFPTAPCGLGQVRMALISGNWGEPRGKPRDGNLGTAGRSPIFLTCVTRFGHKEEGNVPVCPQVPSEFSNGMRNGSWVEG